MTSKDNNIFKGFKVSQFKKTPPPKNDSETTKKELEYIGNINLDKRFYFCFSKFHKFLNLCRTIEALHKERQILYYFTGASCTNLTRLPPTHKTL